MARRSAARAAPPTVVRAVARGNVRRAVDLVLALAILVVCAPLLAALVLALWRTGQVMTRERRVGLHGRNFMQLRFDVGDAERNPRAPALRRFLARTHLSELPQLANILRGEMSFVGPRAPSPDVARRLTAIAPHFDDRYRVRPGLIGWAQLRPARDHDDADRGIRRDLFYVTHQSLSFDLYILWRLIRLVVAGR
jgi:lipopolysaccharide/colanic/teichoic acid biosynthesis glycosyltransferase